MSLGDWHCHFPNLAVSRVLLQALAWQSEDLRDLMANLNLKIICCQDLPHRPVELFQVKSIVSYRTLRLEVATYAAIVSGLQFGHDGQDDLSIDLLFDFLMGNHLLETQIPACQISSVVFAGNNCCIAKRTDDLIKVPGMQFLIVVRKNTEMIMRNTTLAHCKSLIADCRY